MSANLFSSTSHYNSIQSPFFTLPLLPSGNTLGLLNSLLTGLLSSPLIPTHSLFSTHRDKWDHVIPLFKTCASQNKSQSPLSSLVLPHFPLNLTDLIYHCPFFALLLPHTGFLVPPTLRRVLVSGLCAGCFFSLEQPSCR